MEKKNGGFKGFVITFAVILFSVISFIIKVLINSTPAEDFPSFTPVLIGVIFIGFIGYAIYTIFFSKDSFYVKKRLEKKAQKKETAERIPKEKTLREIFEEKSAVPKKRGSNWILIAIVITILFGLLGGAFYWFEYRPTQIRKSCSYVKVIIPEVQEVTLEESEDTKVANRRCKQEIVSSGNCSDIDSSHSVTWGWEAFSKWAECESCNGKFPIKEQTSYQPSREEYKEALEEDYQRCLRNNGIQK